MVDTIVEGQTQPYPFKKPSIEVTQRLLKSKKVMQDISEYLSIKQTLQLQLLDKQFYQDIVPNVMEQRKMFPSIDPQAHLYIHEGQLWGLKIPSQCITREVEFEDDGWIHENQHELDQQGHHWPEKYFDIADIGKDGDDPELKIAENEEVLIQNVFQIGRNKFIIFPVTDTVQIKRGLIVELGDKDKNQGFTTKKTPPPPRELIRPGIIPQRKKKAVTDIFFCGGNQERQCHSYNIEKNVWTVAGTLPSKHIITEQILVQYEDKQTMSLFALINFETNKFQLKSAVNQGNVGLAAWEGEWTWLADSTLDLNINNFHIKCATIIQNKLVIFARGQPEGVLEVVCSFLLIFDLIIEKSQIKKIDPDFKYIKLDALSYGEYQSQPQVVQNGDDLIIRIPQEDNHTEGFPRQLLEFLIPKSDLSKSQDLNQYEHNQKIITIDFSVRS